MLTSLLLRQFFCLTAASFFFWISLFPGIQSIALAQPGKNLQQPTYLVADSLKSWNADKWYEVDKALAEAFQQAYAVTEEFARDELDSWENELLDKVDREFLGWYFNYFNKKAMEFGIPFVWLAFKVDFMDLLKKEDEKTSNSGQIIQQRMIHDFNRKFSQLVLNEEAERSLKKIVDRVAKNYTASIGVKFSLVKADFQVPETDWNQHLDAISHLIYNTGTGNSTLSSNSFNSNLLTKVLTFTTITIGGKLAAKFAVKAGSSLAAKASGALAVKVGAQLLDPLLAIGFLVWDVWDYQHMVAQSKPALRKNIEDYLNQMKSSILEDDASAGILDAIQEVQNKLLSSLASRPPE